MTPTGLSERSSGLGGRALVGFHLVHGELELPASVVGEDQIPCGGACAIEQRAHQAMLQPMARTGSGPPRCSGPSAPSPRFVPLEDAPPRWEWEGDAAL